MKFLITGSAGFVGSKTLLRLLEKYGSKKNEFVLIIKNRKPNIPQKYRKITTIKECYGDISDKESIAEYFVGVDYVFHLAAKLDYGDLNRDLYFKINVTGTENVVELALENNVKKIVYLSSAAIYHPTHDKYVDEYTEISPKHTTQYTKTKYLSYKKVNDFIKIGAPIIGVLPVSVYGEGSPLFTPFIKQIKKFRIAILPKIDSRLSMVYVDDLADGVLLAFEKGVIGQFYIFSGPDLSVKEIVLMLQKAINKKIYVFEIPTKAYSLAVKLLDIANNIFSIKSYYNFELFQFVTGGLLASHEKALSDLAYSESNFENNFHKMIKSI